MIKCMIITALIMLLAFQWASAHENNINPPSGRLFNLTTTGNNLSIKSTKPGWFYQFAGIKSLTPGFGFTNCTPADNNGFCLFQVSDTVAAMPVLAGPAIQPQFKVCLNGIGNTYSCERVQLGERFAYVSNFNTQTITLCQIKSDGSFGACTASGNTGAIFIQPYQVAINKAGFIAYVVDTGASKVFVCPITSNGTFGACEDSGNTGVAFDAPSGIVLNKAETFAYITNQLGGASTGVSVCPIKADGFFGNCVASGNTGVAFSTPQAIALNNANTIAYVTNGFNDTVSICPITSGGTFGACVDSGNTGVAFNEPSGIVLNNTGAIAYVTNFANATVSICPINTDGAFGICVDSGNTGSLFSAPYGIVLNNANTIAYVASSGTSSVVSKCPINTDGRFGVCVDLAPTGDPFDAPISITLF